MKVLPSKVRSARERAMLSQDEVADQVGASGFSVWRWEHGEEPVGIRSKHARRLHKVLDVEPGALAPDEEPAVDPQLKAVVEQANREAKEAEAAGTRIIALSDDDNTMLMERVRVGDTTSLEAQAAQLEKLYRRALRLDEAEIAARLADGLAAALAALALARGGTLEDIQDAILRALDAREHAHASVDAGA